MAKIRCHDCNGTGDCPDHQENYIDVDVVSPCPVCRHTMQCPTCDGTGEIDTEYVNYLSDVIDPRD